MRLRLIGFVAGCVVLQIQATLLPVWLLLGVLVLCLLSAMVSRRRLMLFHVLLVAAAVVADFGWSGWRVQQRMVVALSPAWESRDIIATGMVAESPQLGDDATRFLFHIGSSNAGGTVPPHVRLSWYGTCTWGNVGEEDAKPDRRAGIPDLQPDQRWQLTLRLKRPHGLTNPGGLDDEYTMLADNIRTTGCMRTGKRAQNIALDETGTDFGIDVECWRAGVRHRILGALPDGRHAAVIVALVMDDQSGITPDDWDLFRHTGISHLVSTSGLYITMIAGLFAALWMALQRRSFWLARWAHTPLPLRMSAPRIGAIAAMLATFTYCLFVGMGIPTQRTLLMLSTVAVARPTDRNVLVSLSLCQATAAVAVMDPQVIMPAGFWLSFDAVAIIFIAAQMALDGHRSENTGWVGATRRAFAGGMRIQFAVTFGLLPLTLLLLQQTSVVSVAANGPAIPAVSLVTIPLALIGAALPDPLVQPVLASTEASFRWLVVWLEWLAKPRWSVWVAPVGPIWAVLLSMVAVALLLVSGGLRAWTWRAQGALLLLPLVLVREPLPSPGEFRLVAFDIGQGAAALVETADHRPLFDTGPRYGDHVDAAARVIAPYLRAHGVEAPDTLAVSHENNDHVGGTETMIDVVPVRTVLASLPPGHALRGTADANNIDFADCLAEQAWTWDDVVFGMLHPRRLPAESERVSSNAHSCVLHITNGRHAALLTGNIEAAWERALIAAETSERLMADILLVPHHGSKTSSSGAFLDAVSPQVAISQVGYHNRYGHPHPQVWQRYVVRDIDGLCTDKTGAVVIQTDGDVLDIQTTRAMRLRY